MRIKINYTFFGGSTNNQNKTELINIDEISEFEGLNDTREYIGSYDESQYIYPNLNDDDDIENLKDEYTQYFIIDQENSTEEIFNQKNTTITTISNGGSIDPSFSRNGIEQPLISDIYSSQCIYISIYDYLCLKQNMNISFHEFRTLYIDPRTSTENQWDGNNLIHKKNITNLAKIFELDIRVWVKNRFNKNLDHRLANTRIINDTFRITPGFRRGVGNKDIVNILSFGAHFELILAGQLFNPLLSLDDFIDLPINTLKKIKDYSETIYIGQEKFMQPVDYDPDSERYNNMDYDSKVALYSDLFLNFDTNITNSTDNHYKDIITQILKNDLQTYGNITKDELENAIKIQESYDKKNTSNLIIPDYSLKELEELKKIFSEKQLKEAYESQKQFNNTNQKKSSSISSNSSVQPKIDANKKLNSSSTSSTSSKNKVVAKPKLTLKEWNEKKNKKKLMKIKN